MCATVNIRYLPSIPTGYEGIYLGYNIYQDANKTTHMNGTSVGIINPSVGIKEYKLLYDQFGKYANCCINVGFGTLDSKTNSAKWLIPNQSNLFKILKKF